MAEIINVQKEHLPKVRFIGKRYTDENRLDGGFGHLWGEWFEKGWFNELEKLGEVPDIENGYLGFMRCYPNFEYWIGIFLPPDTAAPEGYSYFDMPAGDVGVCWIKGSDDDGSLYEMHEQCLEKLKENGMGELKEADDRRAFFFERYNCPRFTHKDADGNVILDYGVYLA